MPALTCRDPRRSPFSRANPSGSGSGQGPGRNAFRWTPPTSHPSDGRTMSALTAACSAADKPAAAVRPRAGVGQPAERHLAPPGPGGLRAACQPPSLPRRAGLVLQPVQQPGPPARPLGLGTSVRQDERAGCRCSPALRPGRVAGPVRDGGPGGEARACRFPLGLRPRRPEPPAPGHRRAWPSRRPLPEQDVQGPRPVARGRHGACLLAACPVCSAWWAIIRRITSSRRGVR